MIKVAKFGGSSVASAEQFKKVKDIVMSDSDRRVIVISAAGKKNSSDHKLTDLLYLCHAHIKYGVSCEEIYNKICSRFIEIRDELGLEFRIEDDLEALRKELTREISVDYLVSRGEYLTSRLMAEFLGFHFLDAKDCILMEYDGSFKQEEINVAISKALEQYGKLVIPGFYGSIPSGKTKVMSRGGGDITGSLAAVAVNADMYENWTDVSGILMADPKIVKNPRPISRITYAELRELSYMGASVINEEAVLPVRNAGISLNIRNTNKPQEPGTVIESSIEDEDLENDRFISGVTGRKDYVIITIQKDSLSINSDLGKALSILENFNTKAEQVNLGLDSFALVLRQSSLGENLYNLVSELKTKLAAGNVDVQENIALVAAVGRKMTIRPGISGKVFKALGDNGINVRTIAQGSDELSIVIGVDSSMFETATRVLCEGFAG